MKLPYYRPRGYPDGIYRVGPLARLNLASRMTSPRAARAWRDFRRLQAPAVLSSFHYHYARLVEVLHAVEGIEKLLAEPEALETHVRAFADANNREGIGVAEAPRGTLIHHYRTDAHGRITWANLVIATGHNNLAMNRGVLQAARRFVRAGELSEGMLNRVEAVIRAFDPCLSCSTHALGEMALHVELRAADGSLAGELRRRG
jgi:NAD-reducing hydrogenase large subunit